MSYECQFCQKEFKHETTFMKHHCGAKEKHEQLQQPIGQAAYAYYSIWMQEYKRKVPPIETFVDSRYFKTFLDFAKMVQELQLPNTALFITLMKQKDISPLLWTRNECYRLYLEYVDINADPLTMVQISLETLMKKQEDFQTIDLAATLVSLNLNEMIHLVQLRKLSPWLLLCSGTFKKYILALSQDERDLLMKVIVPEYWAIQLQSKSSDVEEIKQVVSAIGLNT